MSGFANAANTYPNADNPVVLLDSTKIIAVKIGEAVITTAPTYAVAFVDKQETVQTSGNALGSFTASYAQAVAAPAAGQRSISSIIIANIDTVTHTFFVNVAPTGTPGTVTAALFFTYTLTANATASLTSSGVVSSSPLTLPLSTLNGGTGSALTPVIGDLLYANSTTTFTRLADVAVNQVLHSGGVGVAPAWGQVQLSSDVTGTLPVTNGGTGLGNPGSSYSLITSGTTNTGTFQVVTPIGSAGNYLRSQGAGTLPLWSSITLPNSVNQGDILTATSGTAVGSVADVAAGSYLRSGGIGSVPVWSTPTLPNAASTALKWLRSDGTNFITSTSTLSDTPSTALKWLRSDGTNWITSSTTHYDTPTTGDLVIASSGTAFSALADVAVNQVLLSGGVGVAPSYGLVTNAMIAATTIDLTAKVTGALPIANGGTNSSTAISQGRPIISNATALVESIGYRSLTNANNPYTVVAADCMAVFGADASGGALGITLPTAGATNQGFQVTIINVGASGTPTYAGTGTDKIDGQASLTWQLNTQYSHVTLRSSGGSAGWYTVDAVDWVQNSVALGSAIATGASAVYKTLTSVVLTPGEWDMSYVATCTGGASTITNTGIATTTNSSTGSVFGDNTASIPTSSAVADVTTTCPSWRVVVTANPKTYYLTVQVTWTAQPNMYGRLSARRVH